MTEIELKSEMTGVICRILVAVGDVVAEDDPLIVIESMKMEIPIVAPKAGRVTAIRGAEGDPISEGDAPITLAVG
jgi:acetyl-CoA carboxylase biotin carboxyl carrier protein